MSLFKSQAYIFTLLCFLLEIKQLYEYSDTVSVIFTLLLFLMSLFCITKLIGRSNTNKIMNSLFYLVVLFSVYGFAIIIEGQNFHAGSKDISNRMYIMDIYRSLFPIFAYYYYSKCGMISISFLKKVYWIWFALTILIFFKNEQNAILNSLIDVDGVVNNTAYSILSLLLGLPLFIKNKSVPYVILGVVAAFLLLGAKRGALIIYPFCLLFYTTEIIKNSAATQKRKYIFFFSVFTALLIGYVWYRYTNDVFFQSRIELTEEGVSSGRDILYTTFWNHFVDNPNIFQQLFGEGAMATIKVSYNFAHNDWLEILINQGVLGVLFYLFYWISICSVWKKTKHVQDVSLCIGLFGIIFLMKTFYSMSYTDVSFCAACLFGYYLSEADRLKTKMTPE